MNLSDNRTGEPGARLRRLAPGLATAAAATVVAMLVNAVLPALSVLTVAVVLGVLVGGVLPTSTRDGLRWAARTLLRTGVVLLGLHLSLREVLGLGFGTLLAVLITVLGSYGGILLLGRLLRVPPGLGLMVATGSSICGASAIAAMDSVSDTDSEDVAAGVAMVTVYGTAAMALVPLLGTWWGWSPERIGAWAGLSVHEVAQVVAAASPVGAAAVGVAVMVKLTRVVLLAPIVTGKSLLLRSRSGPDGQRPPLVPAFVLGFLLMIGVRSADVLPEPVVDLAWDTTTVLFAAALFGLGTAVRPHAVLRGGWRGVVFGGLAAVLVAAIGAGVLPLTGYL